MKRTISLLVSLVLLLCLLPAPALSAAAEGTINYATVTIPHPVAGHTPERTGTSGDPSHFTVTEVSFYPLDGDNVIGYSLTDHDRFHWNQSYRVQVTLTAAPGWIFTEQSEVTINGKNATLQNAFEDGVAYYYVDMKPKLPFTDVKASDWYVDAVMFCYETGLMVGTKDNAFSPQKPFSRAMLVTVLASGDGSDISSYTGSHFADVKPSRWYAKAVEWAYLNNYAGGTGDGKFSPDTAVTRETLAVFFHNYLAQNGFHFGEATANLSAYPDGSQVSPWAREAMAWALDAGVMGGTKVNGKLLLQPKKTATRAEVAQFVMQFCSYIFSGN